MELHEFQLTLRLKNDIKLWIVNGLDDHWSLQASFMKHSAKILRSCITARFLKTETEGIINDYVEPLVDSSKAFDQTSGNPKSTQTDAENFLRLFLINKVQEDRQAMDEMMLLGHALFSIGVHYLVAQHPEFLAEQIKRQDSSDKEFKDNEQMKYYCAMLVTKKESAKQLNDRHNILR